MRVNQQVQLESDLRTYSSVQLYIYSWVARKLTGKLQVKYSGCVPNLQLGAYLQEYF